MWAIDDKGFASAVQKHGQKHLTVRFRARAHAENYKAAFPDLLGKFEIIDDDPTATDYPYRFKDVPHAVWGEVGRRTYSGINYSNFKGHLSSLGMHAWHDLCSRVWGLFDNRGQGLDGPVAKDKKWTKAQPFEALPVQGGEQLGGGVKDVPAN
jgi:hypothetical protein